MLAAGRKRFKFRRDCCCDRSWQSDLDGGSGVRVIVSRNISAVFLDDAVTDAQTKSRPFAHTFGGVEGIEDALRIFDPGAVVAELCAHVTVLGGYANFQLAVSAGLKDRIDRIVDDVKKYLLNLVWVGDDHGRFRG